MDGNIALGSGQDIFTNSGGTVTGSILGGGGDDIFIIDDKALKIVENAAEGWDVEKSSVSFTLAENVEEGILLGKQDLAMTGSSGNDLLYGNKGNNHIAASLGEDHIAAGGGNDTLTGGVKGAGGDGSEDVFIFKPHSGSDIITDFEAGTDNVSLGGYGGFGSYADLKPHIHQVGNDVVIDLTDGDKITLLDTHKADLHAGDFSF